MFYYKTNYILNRQPNKSSKMSTDTAKMESTSGPRTDYMWDHDKPEPHAGRKAALIKYYPELSKLMGPEPLTKWVIFAVVTFQTLMAFALQNTSWPVFLICTYIFGASANQNLFLAIHELSHKLGSKSAFRNRVYTLIANFPIGIPFGITFAPYHLEHHRFQGHDNIDTDIPTIAEADFFGSINYNYPVRCFMKALFMSIQILFYALRPVMVRPQVMQKLASDPWYQANTVVQILFDVFIYSIAGVNGLVYLLLSTFLAGSIHPLAGHFLAEHYVFDGQGEEETFSYYGWMNFFTYNVGWHSVHHDFPSIPWTRLPQAHAIAREYYDTVPECKSWWGAIVRYIFDDSVGPYSRVKRPEVLAKHVTNAMIEEETHEFFRSRGIKPKVSLQSKDSVASIEDEDEKKND